MGYMYWHNGITYSLSSPFMNVQAAPTSTDSPLSSWALVFNFGDGSSGSGLRHQRVLCVAMRPGDLSLTPMVTDGHNVDNCTLLANRPSATRTVTDTVTLRR